MHTLPALACLLLALLLPRTAPAQLRAAQMDARTATRLRVGGPDAIAGIGDWALGNGTLCAAIAGVDHETVLSPGGGVLVDLGHCGRDDDHFVLLQPLFNFSRGNVPPVTGIRAEVEADTVRVVTTGGLHGVRFETLYELDLEDPRRLRIVSTLERETPGPAFFVFGDVALHGTASLQPFTANTRNPDLSIGYAHPPVDPDSPLTMARGIRAADLQVLVAGPASPGIAYGLWLEAAELVHVDGRRRPLQPMGLNGDDFSILGVFANPLRFGGGRIGLLQLAQLPFMNLAVGEKLVFARSILVGDRSDVASLTDRIWADAPRVSGRVDDRRARISVSRADGVPMSDALPDADGRFALHLPPGEYHLVARTPDGREAQLDFPVPEDGAVALRPIELGAPARLRLPDIAPARLVFRGVDGTPDPLFDDDGIDLRFGGVAALASVETNQLFLAGLPGDPREALLAPGRYRVFATRGPEFELTETRVELTAGQTQRLDLPAPTRAFTTPGWISADLHVHAEPSDDSGMTLERRLASFVAEGADVIVSTDHDRVTDFAPLLAELGLAGRISSLVGSEITTTVRGVDTPSTAGHYNVFPLHRDPLSYADGAPAHEGRRLRAVIGDLRAEAPVPLVQLNHPRALEQEDGALFTHLSLGHAFDPTRPLTRRPNHTLIEPDPRTRVRDLDFDALELLNGSELPTYRMVRADWFSLLLQGEVRTATANSDTHTARRVVALPRSYVAMASPGDATLDSTRFLSALRAGRVCGSTGPLLQVDLEGAGPGQRHTGAEGTLRVAVRSASWVPISRARIFMNGDRLREEPIRPGEELSVPLRFERDAFVFVEVEGNAGDAYAQVAPDFTPFAFCNPIFVDADGDGAWTAPGLPVILPAAIRDPGSI